MDRPFEKDNAKDRFAVESIIPFLIERIRHEKSKQIVDLATSMCVFPYRTVSGTRLGCLNEPGTKWYFVREGYKTTFSTNSYRILDTKVLKSDVANDVKELFGRLGLVSEYSEANAIIELIDRMSEETDYTVTWWKCAFDVFALWKQGETRIGLADATRSIENDAFLFLGDYCSNDLREKLVRFGVYRDIKNDVAKKYFWGRLSRDEGTKAEKLLVAMGVPHTFVIKGSVSHRILSLFERIARTVSFDFDLDGEEQAMCDLCHQLLFDRIYKESDSEFRRILTEADYNLLSGVPVLNKSGGYVPLSLDLFYADDDLRDTGLNGSPIGFESMASTRRRYEQSI